MFLKQKLWIPWIFQWKISGQSFVIELNQCKFMALTFHLGFRMDRSRQKSPIKNVSRLMAKAADQKCKIERVNDMKFDAFLREVLKNQLKKHQSTFGRSSFPDQLRLELKSNIQRGRSSWSTWWINPIRHRHISLPSHVDLKKCQITHLYGTLQHSKCIKFNFPTKTGFSRFRWCENCVTNW